jgi:hypothetical protein
MLIAVFLVTILVPIVCLKYFHIVSVIIDGVWIGNRIYWTLIVVTTTVSLSYTLQRAL